MHFYNVFVIVLSFICSTQSKFDIDDSILFRIDFPGQELLPETSPEFDVTKLPKTNSDDSSAFKKPTEKEQAAPASILSSLEHEPETKQEVQEVVSITTRNMEEFDCSIPKLKPDSSKNKGSYTGVNVLSLLQKVFVSQTCAFRIEHYWTYELCHGKYLRQFHEERDGKKVKVTEYFLGRYTKEQFDTEEAELRTSIEQKKNLKPQIKKIENMNLPYYEIVMKDGTVCDLTGRPRITRVLYVCFMRGNHEIYSFRESSTCEYEVIVLSSLICQHPEYRPEETIENSITCKPSKDKSSKKPKDLMEIESDALMSRQGKMFEAHLMPGQKGPGSVKIEIRPAGSYHDTEDDEMKESSKNNRDENWTSKLRREPFKQLNDPKIVKQFLKGEHCLHGGGSGWWKFEFCFGKAVNQYHEEKPGQRETVISLGRFDEKAHLEWMKKNYKEKKPKPSRKQVSHFYSNGDICPETDKHRHIEVKLKCKPSESSSAVSLYLIEPKTCEYTLVVESPLVCDILPYANEETGLIDMSIDFFDRKTTEPEPEKENPEAKSSVTMVKFTAEDAVESPYGDPKNIPYTDDDLIIITDYQESHHAEDYDDEQEEKEEP